MATANGKGTPTRAVRTLIVDDDRNARGHLRGLLGAFAEVDVVGEATDGRAAALEIERLRPDLVFMDVEMPDLDGFDVIERLGVRSPHVIFVSGYDRHAVRAFDVDALDYLVKPVDTDRLRRAVTRAVGEIRTGSGAVVQGLGALLGMLSGPGVAPRPSRIAVRDGHRIRLIGVDDIDWIEATDKLAVLHVGKHAWSLRDSLSRLEKRLDPERFMRVHRSSIVNISRIDELQTWAKGDYFIRLRDGTRLTTGPAYRSNVQRLLKGLSAV